MVKPDVSNIQVKGAASQSAVTGSKIDTSINSATFLSAGLLGTKNKVLGISEQLQIDPPKKLKAKKYQLHI